MNNIIRQMREILGNHYTSQINIHILSDEIYFGIYEVEVCIIVDLKGRDVYVECEGLKGKLSSGTLDELSKICELLEDNLDVFVELLKWNEEE